MKKNYITAFMMLSFICFSQKSNNTNIPTSITGPIQICPGVPTTYSCAPLAGSTTHWSVSNGTFLGNNTGNSVIIVFDTDVAGPYQIEAWYENATCATEHYNISVDRQPIVLDLVQTQNPVCGSSFATYSVADVGADSYFWTIVPQFAGSVQTGQNTNEVSILWNQYNGPVHIKIEARKCETTYLVQHLINVVNSPVATINGNTNLCTGNSTNFSISLNPSATFDYIVWDFGDGTTQTVNYTNSSSFITSHQYNDPLTTSTTYQITATVHGAGTCIMPAVATKNVTVSPSPIVHLTPNNNINICDTLMILQNYVYSVNIQSGFASTYTIQWYKNNIQLPNETAAQLNVQPYGVGEYYALVTNSFGCSETTEHFEVINDCNSGCVATYQVDAEVYNQTCSGFEATATLVEGNPINTLWSVSGLNQDAVINSSTYSYSAANVKPGKYNIKYIAQYQIDDQVCNSQKQLSVIVPYKPGIKYKVTCNGTANYNVQLLDFSVYYPETPIQHFSFTLDNGNSWYAATFEGGIAQFNTTLPPGSYPIGIKISRSGYAPCTYFENLVLPAMPNAAFTATTNNCDGSAVQFTALDNNPDLQYHWTFDGCENLQQNPVRVFNSANNYAVQLTVTNKYGCSSTTTQFVTVLPVNMNGLFVQQPTLPCVGQNAILHYNGYEDTESPTSIKWYHNSIETAPIATTTAPNLDLTVNQSGYYIGHVTDAYGCTNKYIRAVAVAFVPVPETPEVTGVSMVCQDNPIRLSVPVNESIVYNWTINGYPQSQFNNQSNIEFYPPVLGNYTFAVTASVQNEGQPSCTSLPATKVVAVVPPPVVPELSFEVITCMPYYVKVQVTNVQQGVLYYWSNGTSGPITYMTHDGPLQVRAEINGCQNFAQIDLPIDIDAVSWVFPTGCFESCEHNPLGYILGPNGNFSSWSWLQDGLPIATGSNEVTPLNTIEAPHQYNIRMNTGFCEKTIGAMNVQSVRCDNCDIVYELVSIQCFFINNEAVYKIKMNISSGYPQTLFMNFVATQNEGFFVGSTLPVTNGTNLHEFYFSPINNFVGGTVSVKVQGELNPNMQCIKKLTFEFPDCSQVAPRDEIKLGKEQPLLVAAPNPASSETKLFYNFGVATANDKTIEVVDFLGRSIFVTTLQEDKGIVLFDTTTLASGTYMVVLRSGGVLIKNIKLVIHN